MENIISIQVAAELERQHISRKELDMAMQNSIGVNLAQAERDDASSTMIITLSTALGCNTDYLLGNTRFARIATEQDNKRIGFDVWGRYKYLFEKLDKGTQIELLEVVRDFCADRGIIYSRIDATERREKLTDEIIEMMKQLGNKNSKEDI